MNKVRDRVFKAFSKSVGVKSMREHEARLEAAQREAQERQGKLRRQIVELRGAEDLKRSHGAEIELKRARYADALEVCLCVACTCAAAWVGARVAERARLAAGGQGGGGGGRGAAGGGGGVGRRV